MAKSSVTQEDLVRTELRINEEQKEARHNIAQTLTKVTFDMDELKTENSLNKHTINSMTKTLEKIESKLDLFIESADKKFASKDDHKHNSNRLDKIESILQKINWIVISGVLAALLALVVKV